MSGDRQQRIERIKKIERIKALEATSADDPTPEPQEPENPSQKRVSFARRMGGVMFPPLLIANAIEEGGGSIPATVRSAVNTATLGNLRYNEAFKKQTDEDKRNFPGSVSLGKAPGYAALAVPSVMAGPGWLAAAGLGAAQGGLTNPETDAGWQDDLKTRGINAGIGAAVGTGAKALGSAAGKVGDYAMQKAVGAKEYIKGLGTRMADEGLWGTKGMMLNKIGNEAAPGRLAAREAALAPEIAKVKGLVPSAPSVDAISAKGSRLVPKNPNIPIDPGNVDAVKQAEARALYAASRGNLAPSDAIDVARGIDAAAYDTTIPAGRWARDLSKADSGALREALKKLADAQGLTGVREGLASEQALIMAREALKRPETFNQALTRLGTRAGLAGIVGGGAGYAREGNVMGALPYAAGAAALSTPMGMSTIGQGTTKFSQGLPLLTPAMIDQLVRRSQMEPIDGGEQ